MKHKLIEKVLSKQFGAIKPPWIHIDNFYHMPFNYCDRWCERCKLLNICQVYQKELQRNKQYSKKGINPKGWEATFQSLKEDFNITRQLLEKKMEQLNITGYDIQESATKYEADHADAENDRLYKRSYQLMFNLVKYLEHLQYYLMGKKLKAIEEPYTTLGYYCHFFSPKIYRSILSGIEEKKSLTMLLMTV